MKNIYKYTMLYIVLFILVVTLFHFVDRYKEQSIGFQKDLLLKEAQTHFLSQVNTRHWNAQFGGVYVKPTYGIEPNPYLPNNTLKVDENLTLIKINPAWMTRQLSELSDIKDFSFKITSLYPLNPNNEATPFEEKALNYMEKNNKLEYSEIDENNTFNYMGGLITTKDCLTCHAHQGYKVGDMRGGISVNIGANGYKDILLSIENQVFIIKLIIFIFLLSITMLIYKQFRSNENLQLKILNRTKELEYEKNYIHKILDTNPNIIIVTDMLKIKKVNKVFFTFFKFETIEQFLEKHTCICDYFLTLDGKDFPVDRQINNKSWHEYILENENENHIVKLKKDDEIYYFNLSAKKLNENNEVLIILSDITELKRKEKLLSEQTKMASMGEMIGNIAHQWRQPLSVISTAATGMHIQKEYNILTDKEFFQSCELIDKNAQYLSTTIDDFKNFIKGDRDKNIFNLSNDIHSFIHLVDGSARKYNIKFILELDDDIKIDGYENELIQCFINIFNNAKDVLKEINEDNRYIFITTFIDDKSNAVIKIKDNAGGIPIEIIEKIFEPYFTTKHQSQGTGLGLNMTYNLIVDGMNGIIEANNENYSYLDTKYSGAVFTITLPMG